MNTAYSVRKAPSESDGVFFSVCMITYNRARFLEYSIKNILRQTYRNFELIIADDGSTDDSSTVISGFGDDRIKYYSKPHTNAPDTRNFCLSKVTGNYIIWVDSDDILPNESLSILSKAVIEFPEADIFYGNIVYLDKDHNFIREDTYEDWYGKEYLLPREIMLANKFPNAGTLLKRKVYDETGGYNTNFLRAHDYEFWSRVVGRYKMKHLDYVQLKAVWHDGNMSAATVARDTSYEERIILSILNSRGIENLFPEVPWHSSTAADVKAMIYQKIALRFTGLERWQKAVDFARLSNNYVESKDNNEIIRFCQGKINEFRALNNFARSKLLLVVHNFVPYRFAGVENYVYSIALELLNYGFEIHVLYPFNRPGINQPFIEDDTYKGLIIHRLNSDVMTGFNNHLNNESFNLLFRELLEREKFQAVHFHHTLSLSFSLIDVAKSLDIPVIVTLHDFWFFCLRVHLFHAAQNDICSGPESLNKCARCFYQDAGMIEQTEKFLAIRNDAAKHFLPMADLITAPSKFVAGKYIEIGYASAVEVAPLGVQDVEALKKNKSAQLVFGYMGSVQPVKNIDTLITAFKNLGGPAELLLYANGEDKDIQDLKEKIRSDRRIKYMGEYQPEDAGKVLGNIHVLVLPSLMETYSLVIREALNSGTPVLAARRGAMPEIIQDGINGFLFDAKDYSQLTGLMSRLIIDTQLLQLLRTGVKPCITIQDDAAKWINRYRGIMRKRPKVSIVTLCYNQRHLTEKYLESLYKNTPQDLFELILVDNASSDGTDELLMKFASEKQNVKIKINPENAGFARGNNQGAEMASADYLLLLNNDTEPLPGWLQPLIETLNFDEHVAAAGSKLLFSDGTLQHAGVGIILDKRSEYPIYANHLFTGMPGDTPQANIPRSYQALTAACLLIRKSDFAAVGGLDEGFWNGYEDVDLCFKLRALGKKIVYIPQSVLIHHESKSGTERFAKADQNAQRLQDKWIGKTEFDFIMKKDGSVTELKYMITAYYPGKKTSIVIPLYNNLEYTRQCYESILKYTTSPFEVIFVDNASTDSTAQFIAALSAEKKNVKAVFNDENKGFPGAVNHGIKEASGDYIVIANNDILFTPLWLERMISLAESHQQIGITGPVSNSVSGVQIEQTAKYKTIEEMYKFAEKLSRERTGKFAIFPRVAFLCTLIKKEVIEKIGGLDERFAPGNFEDDDYCLRAELAGYKTAIAQDVFIHHFGSKSFLAAGRQQYEERLKVNHRKFVEKWGADPNEIWLQGKKPVGHSIVVPLHRDAYMELNQRMQRHIEDNEFALALEQLKQILGLVNRGRVQLAPEQVEPLLKLYQKLELIVK